MNRERIAAVVGVLACAAAASVGQGMQPERFVLVREAGKASQKCRVLKCWRDKDGNKVGQVQAVDSGEMITVVEPGTASGGGQTASSIRWGGQTTPPPAAPPIPADAQVVGTPQPAEKPALADRVFASGQPTC